MKSAIAMLTAVYLVAGCTMGGTTTEDLLIPPVELSVMVSHETSGDPIIGASVLVERFYGSGSIFKMGTYIQVSRGATDESGYFTYNAHLVGPYQFRIMQSPERTYSGGFAVFQDSRDDQIQNVAVSPRDV